MPNHPSVVARRNPDGDCEGRYVHNNGHPDGRIPELRSLYHGPFGGDVDAMTCFLVDDHPAGWFQLGTDPAADTGWINPMPPLGDNGFRCYCHGDRNEAPQLFTLRNISPDLVDWVYVLQPAGITVLSAGGDNGNEGIPTFFSWDPAAEVEAVP